MNISKYFTSEEMACKGTNCCEHTCAMDSKFMRNLDILRYYTCGLYVSSGFRCKKHNRGVGGVTDSWHTKGKAADLIPISEAISLTMLKQQAEFLFEEVIMYDTFVHVANPL